MNKIQHQKRDKIWIDFHTHSNRSDGKFTRQELIEKAIRAANGSKMIMAITDHNEPFDDLEELQNQYDGQITLISGSEISTTYVVPRTGQKLEVHIVALDYEIHNKTLLKMLKKNHPDNRIYIEKILEKLEKQGIHAADDYEELRNYTYPSPHVGRMAIARKMVDLGYVTTTKEAFDLYFGNYGRKTCFVSNPHQFVSIPEAVKTVKEAKGIPVLAHPYFYNLEKKDLLELISYFKESGGLAVETEYKDYTNEQRQELKEIAQWYNLEESGGSDFHGNAEETLVNEFAGYIYEKLMEVKNKI